MASSGKKKTTMAKLMRESRLRERRLDKQAKKDARKHAPADQLDPTGYTLDAATGDTLDAATGEPVRPAAEQSDPEAVVAATADA
jgi:hypothetical protein